MVTYLQCISMKTQYDNLAVVNKYFESMMQWCLEGATLLL